MLELVTNVNSMRNYSQISYKDNKQDKISRNTYLSAPLPKREYLMPSVPNIPVSRSEATMVVTTVPGLAVSDTRAV